MYTETVTTWYHVAHSTYTAGQDLYCTDELYAMGIELPWKFDGEPFDTDVVCLFDNVEDARKFRDDFCTPDYVLLRVTLPDGAYVVNVEEGFTAVPRKISSKYIEIVND